MKVTRIQVVGRGLTNRCPNCGGRTLFKRGTLFELNDACPRCGLRFERDEGFFLGSVALNYGVTVVGFLVPVLILAWCGVMSGTVAGIVAGAGAVIVPLVLYRPSRSWWFMNYYLFLPQHLPANRDASHPGPPGEENT